MARNTPATAGTPEASDLSGGPVSAPTDIEVIGATAPDPEPEAKPDVPTMKELKGVRYIGNADVKIFEVADLASVGVTADEPLSWHAGNQFFVEAKDLSAAARDFLATQPDFSVE